MCVKVGNRVGLALAPEERSAGELNPDAKKMDAELQARFLV